MTKCIALVVLLFLCLNSSTSFAQKSFQKSDFIVNAGFGLGIGYSYQNYSSDDFYNQYYDYTYSFRFNYVGGTIFPVTAEYAISDKFGIGLAYQHGAYGNLFSDKSTTNSLGLFGAFHLLRKEKIELYTRLILGYSAMDYTEQPSNYEYYDPSNSYVPSSNNIYNFKAKGGYGKPSFGMRLYFTEHFGMFADFGLGVYSYKTNQVETDRGSYELQKRFHYVLYNAELTTGLTVKF